VHAPWDEVKEKMMEIRTELETKQNINTCLLKFKTEERGFGI